MAARIAALALLATSAGCFNQKRIRTHPVEERDLGGVVFLPWASSEVDSFFDGEGKPCAPFDGRIRDSFAGWQSSDDQSVCEHDTFQDTVRPAKLELRWHGTVPADGSFLVLTGGYSVGAWGRVLVRGSYYGDYYSTARVVLEVTSPHCRAEWSSQLALAKLTGEFLRGAEFTGWVSIPDTRIEHCVKGDPLDVRLRLLGDSNRGKIEVDAFGFSTQGSGLNRMFGVRPAPPLPPGQQDVDAPEVRQGGPMFIH